MKQVLQKLMAVAEGFLDTPVAGFATTSKGDNDENVRITLDYEDDIPLVPAYATQDEANAGFVSEYTEYFQNIHNGESPKTVTDLYCSMTLVHCGGLSWWWMARDHPVVRVLRNSGIVSYAEISHTTTGEVIVYAKNDVDSCIIDIAEWFKESNMLSEE